LSKPTVYLAGPITGLSYGGATDWREYARKELDKYGIDAFSPMRGKIYLEKFKDLSGAADAYSAWPLSTAKGITTRDRFDATRVDLVLANLAGADRVSIGTMIEFGWADAHRRPIVTVMEPTGNVHDHAMVREMAGFIVPTLDEALFVARAILTPDAK
jgi:nucleoside 2-deoxyribosyltransferase